VPAGKNNFYGRAGQKPRNLPMKADMPKFILHGMTLFVLRHDIFCHGMEKCVSGGFFLGGGIGVKMWLIV